MPQPLPTEGPRAPEAEQAVLAACLLAPEVLDDLDLTTSDFAEERHRALFTACRELRADGRPVDLRTVQAFLEDHGTLEAAGGLPYLAGLDLALPDLARAPQYAEIVRDRSLKRRLFDQGARLMRESANGKTGAELAAHFRRVFEELEAPAGAGAAVEVGGLAQRVIAVARASREQYEATGEPVFGVRTGLPKLDATLSGLQQGFYLLAGSTGLGKSTLAWRIAQHVARQVPALYVTFENSAENLATKALCAHAGINTRHVRMGYADPDRLATAAAELNRLVGDRLQVIDGDSHLTVGRIRATARRAMERARARSCLVVVDYLQLWAKCSRELAAFSDPRLRVEALAAELLALSRRLDSPVLAISSLSREGHRKSRDGESPDLEHLKESGDLEYGADVALFLTAAKERTDVRPPMQALELRVKKQRNGPLGKVALLAHTEHARVEEEEEVREASWGSRPRGG